VKRSFAMISSLVLMACHSAESSAEGALRFFAGSAEECTEELARLGTCAPGALTRCIAVENAEGEDLVCKVSAKAALRSEATSDTGVSTKVFAVSREPKTSVLCFDFGAVAPARATFGYFTAFHGSCQRGTTASPPRFTCDPESERCTFYEIDRTTCQPGWACHRIYIGKTIQMTKCTPDLVARSVCAAGDPRTYACAPVMNKGTAPLRCDVRLNVERGSGAQPISGLFRSQLLTAGSEEELCFAIEGAAGAEGLAELRASAICRQMEFRGSLSDICDVARSSCEGESKVVEYVQ